MTIERFTFTPPLHVNDVTTVKLDEALMFAKRKEVPPGYKQDITPAGYRDKYVLRTASSEINGQEDTVGEIEFTHGKTGAKRKSNIDEKTPVVVIARPNVLDGGEGVRIDEVVRYIPSIGAQHSMDENTAASVPLESIFEVESSEAIPYEMPTTADAIPVEIPHFDSAER